MHKLAILKIFRTFGFKTILGLGVVVLVLTIALSILLGTGSLQNIIKNYLKLDTKTYLVTENQKGNIKTYRQAILPANNPSPDKNIGVALVSDEIFEVLAGKNTGTANILAIGTKSDKKENNVSFTIGKIQQYENSQLEIPVTQDAAEYAQVSQKIDIIPIPLTTSLHK